MFRLVNNEDYILLFKKFLLKQYAFCVIFCLKIIKPFIHIRIGEIETRLIGHFSKTIEIYLAEQELKNKKKYFDIWFNNKIVSNNYLLKIWKKYLRVYPRIFVEPVFNYLIKNKDLDFLTDYRYWKIELKNTQYMDIHKVLKKTKPKVCFSKEEIKLGEAKLKAIGVNTQKPLYGFFARDDLYRGSRQTISINSQSNIRNFDINDFKEACEFMTNNNYIGIRVGNKTLDKINFKNKDVIDYSKSEYRSDFLDIFLASKCDFYCGGDTGIQHLPSLFRKPLIMINSHFYTSNKQTSPEILDDGFVKLIIFKKIYSLKENKFLDFSKIMKILEQWENNEDKTEGYNDNTFKKYGYKIVNNSPTEIKEVFEEFYLRKNNSWEKKNDEDRLNDLVNNFMIKNNCKKLENIKVGYEFLKNNERLFI